MSCPPLLPLSIPLSCVLPLPLFPSTLAAFALSFDVVNVAGKHLVVGALNPHAPLALKRRHTFALCLKSLLSKARTHRYLQINACGAALVLRAATSNPMSPGAIDWALPDPPKAAGKPEDVAERAAGALFGVAGAVLWRWLAKFLAGAAFPASG